MPATPRPGRTFLDRFGATILRGGIAPVPSTLYFYQAELRLSPQEVWFVGYILAHKWDEDLPHPSLVKMAERVGLSNRQLHRIKSSLTAKGFLSCVPRHRVAGGKDANGYDFSGLFGRLADLIRAHGPRGDRPVMVPTQPEDDERTMSYGDVTPASYGDVTPPSHREMSYGDATPPSYGDVTPTSYRDRTPTSHRDVTPTSQATVTRAAHTHRTPTSHDSEADHVEPKHAEPKHVEPKHEDKPPPTPSNHPTPQAHSGEEEVEVFNQVKSDTNLMIQRLGLDEETATRYARIVRAHHRPPGYVAELLDHALNDPEVRDPVKVVARNIRTNERRPHPDDPNPDRRLTRPRRPRQPGPSMPYLAPPSPRPTPFMKIGRANPESDTAPEEATEPTDYGPIWQSVQAVLRLACRAEEYDSTVRYLQLLEIDEEHRWALLGAPNGHIRDAVLTRLTVPIQMALERACHIPLKLLVVVRTPQATPRLADLLAALTDSAPTGTDEASPTTVPAGNEGALPTAVPAAAVEQARSHV